ncbi:sorting nexin-17 [Drosophila guanche]|uniref:Blast:Sorting nexin-17 n=1 Tax=Drosophila guanche TaxID=7266 RepID=A0A3B0KBV6_DROGU|nr:sorting nexin-17 [Drosophila guanche]SPP85650.1 blast:Sorting nexin-17 [Drosophila guanche]
MHFSIPDTQELGSPTYTVYNIHINGSYHCFLRYKQLHSLNEQMRRHCSSLSLPPFPPKRFLPLTNGQLETRRSGLEQYLQIIGQDARIARLPFLQQFFQRAQLDTALAEGNVASDSEEKQLEVEVYTNPNGAQLPINCNVQQNASLLLKSVCRELKLPEELMKLFCLYLMRKKRESDELVLVRRLMDFESPYITQLHAQPCELLLRTCYWDSSWDAKLYGNKVALNLLYNQTVADVSREWVVICSPGLGRQLSHLQMQGRCLEYMNVVRDLPSYGCLQFEAANVDYPDPKTVALVSIGNKELSLRTARGAKIYETKFRVTRMRSWRVSVTHNALESRHEPSQLQLAFEYLIAKQTLRWITISSDQAMLMSVCLQAMVDQLLHGGGEKPAPSSDDEQDAGATSSASTPSSVSSTSTSTCASTSYSTTASMTTPPVKFLAQDLTPKSKQQRLTTSRTFGAVFFRNDGEDGAHVANEAFEGIGDDDL